MGGKVEFANSLRGFAALVVMATHYVGVFWLARDIAAAQGHFPPLPPSIENPWYAPFAVVGPFFNGGSLGVGIFFLVSGFVIPFSFQRASGPTFMIGRVFRLLPTYAAGFTVTLLAIWASVTYWGGNWPYRWQAVAYHYVPGIRDLIGTVNIDGIVWTLEIEVKFYIVCALVAPRLRMYSRTVFLVPVALFLFAGYVNQNIHEWQEIGGYTFTLPFALAKSAQYIIFMFIGVAFHYHYLGKLKGEQLALAIVGLFSMFAFTWAHSFSGYRPIVWAYLTAIVFFAGASSLPDRITHNRISSFMADISYPLYCCHAFAGYILMRILLDRGVPQTAALLVTAALAIVIAYGIHVLIEMPTHQMGRRVMKRIQKSEPEMVPAQNSATKVSAHLSLT